ncbi:MAG TPA: hypothetical protein PL131_11045 [Methylotenera sp.]|nr:hypothetical protein [Methylotenera sp.]HPH06402.1 hypothetical protein [Methylotenera sp.]HPN01822.1 hypothetical protein [Methylotenera sp.]
MKLSVTIALLTSFVFSSACLAKEKIIKDPVGNSCKASELAVITTVSEPKLATAFQASTGATQMEAYQKNKKALFVFVQFDIGGEFPVEYKEAKKLKLKKGDKKYCTTTVAATMETEEIDVDI